MQGFGEARTRDCRPAKRFSFRCSRPELVRLREHLSTLTEAEHAKTELQKLEVAQRQVQDHHNEIMREMTQEER